MNPPSDFDPSLDLVLERVVNVRPELVWLAWTDPKHLPHWFTPRPWTVSHCELDVRPGGIFHTVMRSPEGDEFPGTGCFLEVVPNQRLAWTTTLLPGYRPSPPSDSFPFSAIITLAPEGQGTRYTATVKHRDEQGRAQHESMGFHDGWSKALDQLVTYVNSLA